MGGGPPRILLLVAVAMLAAVSSADTAGAANVTTDCAHLQATLDAAASGDTITLSEMCAGTTFNLANGSSDSRSYTLVGQSGAGFDGTGAGGRMLSATGASSSPATLTLRNLIFKNGSQPSSGGAVAFQGEYSVTLDHDTFTSNQASSGAGGAVDVETTAPSATITLSSDTFTGNQAPSGGTGLGGAVNIATLGAAGTVTLDGDTFTSNAAGVGGGAVEVNNGGASGSLTVSNSTFRSSTAHTDTGGALDVCDCGGALPVTLSNNTFSSNTIAGGGCGCSLEGGAVFLDNASAGNAALTQTGNTFSGNSLAGGAGDVQGGAESVSGMTLTSTGDVFTGNSIQAPASGHVSQGSALDLGNDCSASVPQHTVTNVAIAGNSITDGGLAANARGALDLTCATSTANPNKLLLRDTTISGNRGGGGTAGVWGDATDQLTVQNAILKGDSDGAELTGFGSSITASYTDLCSGSSPFAGTGNICADPALAGASSGDVHETSSSPTADAGSNSLVPGGVTTDVYAAARIQARLVGATATVDMGAAELATIQRPSASITTPANGATYTFGQSVASSFSCSEGTGGPGVSSCLDQSGHVSAGTVDTSSTGSHTFTVTATSSDGLTGTASMSFTVHALVPSAPTSVSATAGDGQAAVSFAAPSSNGGAAITSYTVTSSPGGVTASGSASPITVTGLSNVTSYTFTVIATNSVGTGSASAPSSAVTPTGAPGAPTGVSVVVGDGQAIVSFEAPTNNGSAITGYTVTAFPGGKSVTGTSSPITVTGLTDGVVYTFTVTATNGVGTSVASLTSAAVKPGDSHAPSAPGGLRGVFVGSTLALSWQAATDNVGVDHYALYLNGIAIRQVAGDATAATTRTFQRHRASLFTVRAFDVAGNASGTVGSVRVVPRTIPKGLPKPISDWAWSLLAWQQHGRHAHRPTTPYPLPRWYQAWAFWRRHPFKLAAT